MEWVKAIKTLDNSQHHYVELEILGYKVSYYNMVIGRKIMIVYYVDGWNKTEWHQRDSELGAKFGKPIYYRVTAKEMKLWTSIYGKKKAEAMKKEWKQKVLLYHFRFETPSELIRFLKSKKYEIKVIASKHENDE